MNNFLEVSLQTRPIASISKISNSLFVSLSSKPLVMLSGFVLKSHEYFPRYLLLIGAPHSYNSLMLVYNTGRAVFLIIYPPAPTFRASNIFSFSSCTVYIINIISGHNSIKILTTSIPLMSPKTISI